MFLAHLKKGTKSVREQKKYLCISIFSFAREHILFHNYGTKYVRGRTENVPYRTKNARAHKL